MKIVQSNMHTPAYNLALEEFLFFEFSTDFLLFYVNEKSVVIGSNQSVSNEVNLAFCRANNIHIVRRKSGGGAVFHDYGNLNFSFIGNKNPESNSLSGDFLKPIMAWLLEMGVEVTRGERKDLWLADGFKITGTASHIRKTRELHHGTLLINADTDMLHQALLVHETDNTVKATPSVRSKTKNILDYLQEKHVPIIEANAFMEKFIGIAERYYDTKKVNNSYFEQSEVEKRMMEYQSNVWNFRK